MKNKLSALFISIDISDVFRDTLKTLYKMVNKRIILSAVFLLSSLFSTAANAYSYWWYGDTFYLTEAEACVASQPFNGDLVLARYLARSIDSYNGCSLFYTSLNYDPDQHYSWSLPRNTCDDGWVPINGQSTGQCVPYVNPTPFYLALNDFLQNSPTDTDAYNCSSYTNNPINISNGNKYRTEIDYTQTGFSPLKFTRYYSSNKNQAYDIGTNWRHSYTASLTANIHTNEVPYVEGDSNFSSLNSTAQLACESGWNDIKTTYNKPEFASSTATYVNNTCTIQEGNGNALGSIAVRDDSTGGISPNPPQDTVVIERANGNTLVFTLVNTAWVAPTDADVSLVQTASGYTLTTAQDTAEQYNLVGQLVSTLSRTGMQQNLAYNATTGLLESVTDSLGNSLSFSYTSSNLSSVTLPDTEVITYDYDDFNNLTTVTREDNSTRSYHYEDGRFANALTGITDGNNQRHMTFSYDALGRAITSELGDGATLSADKVTLNFIDDLTSTVTDALEYTRTYRFININGEKQLSDIEGAPCTSCGGGATHYTYDAAGYVDSKTDFNGNRTTYLNNTRGLALTRTEAVGTKDERRTDYEWHTSYALPTCIIEPLKSTQISYNPTGSVNTRAVIDTSDPAQFTTAESKACTAIEARGDYAALNKRVTSYTYYPEYELLKTIDGPRTDINDITEFTYDAEGNLATIQNALGHVTRLNNYTKRGKPQQIIDANGLVTKLSYDVRGRIDVVTVGSLATDYDFDAVGNLNRVTRPDSSFIDYDYDAAHRLTDIRDQIGNHIHYVLDALGNRNGTNINDAGGNLKRTSTAIYDQLGQLEKTIGAATQTTDYLLYDHNGNLKHKRDPDEKNTFFGYDALNRLETITNELTDSSTTRYDAHSNVISVTDFRGLETTNQYDGLGNRTQTTSPDTGVTQYPSHDEYGNVLSMVDAKIQTTHYDYDALNRIDLVTYADGSVADYVYDVGINATGRLSHISYNDSTARQTGNTAWTYDVMGRVKSKTETVNGIALSISYNYNPTSGRLDNTITPGGKTITLTYLNGQVTSLLLDNQIVMSQISYDPFGAAKAWTWGNGKTVSRSYDQDGQLDTYTLGNSTLDINYTLSGNIESISDLTTASTQQSFNYDGLHRLKDYSGITGNEVYDYDANSNRIALTDMTNTDLNNYDIDPMSNKLLSISGNKNTTYAYDENGSITHDGVNTFTYNARHRLINVSYPQDCPVNEAAICDGVTDEAHYQLNALGQRVLKSVMSKGSDYVILNTTYQQQADAAQLLATSYSEQATGLLTQAEVNETQAQALNTQALADRAEALALNEEADLITLRQQNTQATADQLYTSAASYEALIVEPATSFIQGILNTIYQAIANILTTVADIVQTFADNLAQQIVDLRTQATTLMANAVTAEQQAATLFADAQQFRTEAANLQTLATEQTLIANNAQQKADNYQVLTLSQPKRRIATRYAYNESGQLLGEYDAIGNAKQEIIYFANLPVAVVANNGVHYIYTDHLGTPREITNVNNTTIWSWHSDPFGTTAANDDPDNDGITFTFNHRFAGQYYDVETGLHYNYFRDYDPSTGRYVQSDPIGLAGGLNTYGYVDGNPLYWTDPYGLYSWSEFATDAGNASAGFGDTITSGFGYFDTSLTEMARQAIDDKYNFDSNGTVNQCSAAYSGGKYGAYGWGVGTGAAAAARIAGLSLTFNKYKVAGGFGVNLMYKGARKFGADWHKFKLNGKMTNRPHYHRGPTKSQMKKHRPWQGGR